MSIHHTHRDAWVIAGRLIAAKLTLSCMLAVAGCSAETLESASTGLSNPNFTEWVRDLWPEAAAKGVSRATYDRAFAGITPDPEILERASTQPEFVKPIWDYIEVAASDTRVANGREKRARFAGILDSVEAKYGVDRHVVLAIWGMESGYGANLGDKNVIRSLATLGFQGRRQDFGRAQLLAALQILERGDIAPERMLGSWAGAMGHTQFIPTTYNAYAVDHDGDGRRDIWNTIADALGSTANYLRRSGWDPALPWGYEVVLPQGFDYALTSTRTLPAARWQNLGVRRANGAAMAHAHADARIIAPAGARGPAFLVFGNFKAILRYNNAVAYALAVGLLSDGIRGGGGIAASWPRGDRPLNASEKSELQKRLTSAGFDTGGVDGRLGPKSLEAVRDYQRARGLTPDGYVSIALLEHIRSR